MKLSFLVHINDQRRRGGGEGGRGGSIHVFTDGFGFLLSNTHLNPWHTHAHTFTNTNKNTN